MMSESSELIEVLLTHSPDSIADLMSISGKLSALNVERYQNWEPEANVQNSRPAALAFSGDVYLGMDLARYSERDFTRAQKQIRILSGLYGLLRPLDLIQPYRLEMGTKLKVGSTENLYKFWDDTVAKALNEELEDDELLINLASSEYFKVIPKKVLKVPMITPVFKDFKNGEYKIVMTYAKKARGLMVRYIIDHNVKTIEDLKGFNVDRYRFSEEMSTGNELIFTR